MSELRGPTRYPAVILSYPINEDGVQELNCRIDLKPTPETYFDGKSWQKVGKAHGLMMWRTNGQGKGHDLDKAFDKISRKISRVMQGRQP